jgi:2-phospho-L-lactate/phosphoenolpyruvate guanylyltransferase
MQVLIPLKRLDEAKLRLADLVGPPERRRLMETMLAHVARTAVAAGLGPVALATSEPGAGELAARLGVDVVSDGGLPWNAGLIRARDSLDPRPDALLFLAGDLPLLTTAELQQLAAATEPVVVARARDGGTNALLLQPPTAIDPAFGMPASAAVHRALARRAGLVARVIDLPGLALDVDTPDDLRAAGLQALPRAG